MSGCHPRSPTRACGPRWPPGARSLACRFWCCPSTSSSCTRASYWPNAAIAQRLTVTERAVAKHTASIFLKLRLQPSDDDNRRVLAVLAYLGR